MNPFFHAWGTFVVRYRTLVAIGLVAITGLAIFQIQRLIQVDNSIEAFASSSESDTQAVLEQFRDEFGRDDVFLVLVEGDVFSTRYLETLKRAHEEIAALDLEVASLGERKRDRDLARGRKHVAAPPAVRTATEPEEAALQDDFDDLDDEFGDDDAGEDGWGEEAGGSVVDQVISLVNVPRTRGVDGALQVGDWMDPMPATDAAAKALGEQMLADDTLVGRVIDKDGRLSAIVIRTHFMSEPDSHVVNDAIVAIMDKHEGEGFRYHMAGLPAMSAEINRLMLGDMQGLFLYGVIVLLVILILMFRRRSWPYAAVVLTGGVVFLFYPTTLPGFIGLGAVATTLLILRPIGALAPLAVVAVSAAWAFGLMTTLGMPMTMMSNVLPAFFICVGVADSVHLQSVYRALRADGLANDQAIIQAVADTGLPIFFTSLTTAMGLISFEFASVEAIGEMGRTGAFGVGVAFINTLMLLPVALTFNKKGLLGLRPERKDVIDTMLRAFVGLSRGRRGRAWTLGIAIALTTGAVYYATQLRVWHNPMAWIPGDEPVKIAVDLADEKLAGTSQIQLYIEATGPNGVKDVRLLKGLEALEARVKGYVDKGTGDRIVGSTLSVLDVIRQTNRALHDGDPSHYRVPDTQEEANHLFVAFERQSPADLKRLMSIDATTAQMTIGIKWLEATSYGPLTEYLEEGIAELLPDAEVAIVRPTGAAYTLLTTVSALIGDMIRSFSVAFVVITILMILLLQNLKLGLIAMVPNLLPIAYIMGLMGLLDIPIDMANLLIASIALGIAVDDTIHFLHHFKVHYDETGDVEASIAHSVQHSGRALVITSIILAGGFFVYLAATMYSLQRFGMLIGLTVIIAVVLDLILTPALLRALYRDVPCESRDLKGADHDIQTTDPVAVRSADGRAAARAGDLA